MKQIAFSLLSVVILVAMVLPDGSPAVLAQGPGYWPSDIQWTHPTDCYCDPQEDEYPAQLDLIGNDTIPAVYYYFGADHAFFRERVRGDPSGTNNFTQNAWVVLFDLPEPGNYEYLLSLDGKDEKVQLWNNTVKESLVWDPILKDPAENIVWANSTATYANITDDGTGHYFVDWAIPLTELTPLGITANTTMYFCTSANANNFNKDYLDCYGPDLAITEKSEAWVSLANKTYNVSYTVCNEGAAASAGASNTTITIDGVDILEDPVPELAAGVCYNSTLGPFTMSGANDTITVCADNGNVVDESNEDNNCMENTFFEELPLETYNLTISSSDGGSVTIPGEGVFTYDAGTVVDLVATADANYHFVNWTGDVGTIADVDSATTNVTMNGDYSIVANFAIDRYNLTISSSAGGNVTTPGEGMFTYDAGTVVDLVATADSGYHFVNWTGDVGTIADVDAASTTITMDGDYSIVANFAIDRYDLTTSSSAGGSVTAPGEATFTYNASEVVDLVAAADSGYHFVNWTGDIGTMGDANSATTNITMNGDYSIVANFAIDRYNLTISSSAGGNVTAPGEGMFTYDAGTVVNLVAEADASYHFVNWTGDVGTIGDVDSATTNITMDGDYSIIANFAIDRYNLSISSTSGGSVTTPGEGVFTYDAGTVVDLVATADANYHFVNWAGDIGTMGDANSATTNITMNDNYSIVANFAIDRYDLTISSTSGGSVTAPGEGMFTYDAGTVVNLVAEADASYHFVNWTGDVGTIGDVDSATTNITMDGDYSIIANFALITHTLNISSTPGGNVTTPGEGMFTYDHGTVVDLIATPDANYTFVNWTGDIGTMGDANSATTNITMNGDYSIVANFAIDRYDLTISSSAGGNVTTPGEGVFTYDAGMVVDLVATPDASYHFVNWTGDVGTIADVDSATTNITMNGNYSIVANFAIDRYNLTISSSAGGSVTTPGEGTFTYDASEVVDLVATPDSGYHFVNWTGDVGTIGNVSAASTNITMDGDKSVVANFEEQPKICVDPSRLPLTVAPNETVTTTYTITNCGGGTLNWNSSNVTYDPNGNMTWLAQNPTSGTLTANASDTVLVTVNATGLEVGNYTATITITGSTFTLPVILEITEPDIDVMRNLPGVALMPNQTYPGDTFDVYVNFSAPADEFNAIGLTDLAPDGWTVQVDKTWCTPAPYSVEVRGNKVEILWSGPFSNGTNFSALYKVTVPETATPGINLFPDCDISRAWVEYYFNEYGPYTSCVWGDYEMMITVPSDIVGETRDVNANPLSDVEVLLLKQGEGYKRCDYSTPDYSNTAYTTGMFWQHSTKALYYEINMAGMTMLPPYYINLSTPELLAAGCVFDFEGNYGLVPRACDMSYALKSVNLWLVPPEDHPEWRLDEWKAMESVHSWQYPS
ncbi:hypothetical protein ES706_03349 [subsurface metagenome]